jgi:ABC-type transport system substrate-binding protein
MDRLAAAGYSRNGLYVSKAGEVLRLTLGYPNGDPRLADAARSIQHQLGLIGIEIDLLADSSTDLINTRIASGGIDLALIMLPRGTSDAASAASAFGCPVNSVLGLGSTVSTRAEPPSARDGPTATFTETTPGGGVTDGSTALPRTGNLSGYCEPTTQRDLAAAVTGQGSVSAADPDLWIDLPVLPLIQPAGVFAVSEALRSVIDGPHNGWMWTGPLSGLSGWPVTG